MTHPAQSNAGVARFSDPDIVPPENWPTLGFVTTDEPTWTDHQYGWERSGSFRGNVRGSIPADDHERKRNDRHPELPENAFALTRVGIIPPDRESKHHIPKREMTYTRPEGSWVVDLKYEQCNRSYTSEVYLFTTRIDDSPLYQKWESAPNSRTERRWVEYFRTAEEAVRFVERNTGLEVPRGGPLAE